MSNTLRSLKGAANKTAYQSAYRGARTNPALYGLAQELVAAQDVDVFARAWLRVQLHDGQLRFLRAPEKPTAILVTGRRWGKTLTAAVSLLHRALLRFDYRQCIVSVTLDQAQLSWRYMEQFLQENELLSLFIRSIRQQPFPTVTFKNGSEITVRAAAREGIYLRGHRFDRVIVDEADYVSERVITEVLRMTLADTGGQLVLLTTPRLTRGYVYRLIELAKNGDDTIYVQTGPTFENPNVDHEYIRSLREQLPEVVWKREIEGIYLDDTEAVFRFEDIARAYDGVGWSIPESPIDGHLYVQGVDLAKTNDYTVHVVLDITEEPYRLVHFWRYQRAPWTQVVANIRAVHERYQCRTTLIDATGVGSAVLDEVSDIASGIVFTPKTKADLVATLQLALERDLVRFPFIRELVDELAAYRYQDATLQTDSVFALALALRASYESSAFRPIILTIDWGPRRRF